MSKPLIIGTVVAVAGIFAALGFILWQDVRNQVSHTPAQPIAEQTSPPPPVPAPSPQPQAVDTSNWQTYRNDEFGFEVKYPVSWDVVRITSYDVVISSSQKNVKISDIVTPPKGHAAVRFSFTASSLENYREIAEVSVGEDIGDVIVEDGIFLGSYGSTGIRSYSWKREKSQFEDTFNQILSTFRFVDVDIDAKTGKIYTHRDVDLCFRAFISCETGRRPFSDDSGCGCELCPLPSQLPPEFYENCEQKGGNVSSKNFPDGCPGMLECVVPE